MANRTSWKRLPRNALLRLMLTKMPSRPALRSLPSISAPVAFHSWMSLPRSLRRRSSRPATRLLRTTASLLPQTSMPMRSPSTTLSSTRARSAALSRKMPASMSGRLMPEPRTTSPRTVTSGAEIRITWPLPPPSTTAPGAPSIVIGRSMRTPPRCCPAASRSVSPGDAAAIAACRPSPGGTSTTAAAAPVATRPPAANRIAASRAVPERRRRAIGQADLGWTSMRPAISMCSAWQNHWQ